MPTTQEARDVCRAAAELIDAGKIETATHAIEKLDEMFQAEDEPHHAAALVAEALGMLDEDEPEEAAATLRIAADEFC